ncbi:MAG: hypothetical protein IT480_06975 [Gammaproteobacteria bacterium]|nr:hypothetical protein [Gammaproteobacteria bacterium]
MRWPRVGVLIVLVVAVSAAMNADAARRRARASVADTVRSKTCGSTCLNAFLDRYVEALLAHDPARAELAVDLRSTENGVSVPPGAGLWRTITEIGDYRIRAIDPANGAAALLGVLYEAARPTMFALRLKVQARRISEAELVLARDVPPEFAGAVPRLRTARRAFAERVDPQIRVPRARMIAAAESYYEGVGQASGGAVPFADDCHRIENGVALVNNPDFHFGFIAPDGGVVPDFAAMSCGEQFSTGIWSTDTVSNRRYPVVDEERGLVVAFTQYHVHARGRCAVVAGVGPVCPARDTPPVSLDLVEFFRVGDGRIHDMESVWTVLPPGGTTGW